MKRKPNNNQARKARAVKAILRQHKCAVLNLDPVSNEGAMQGLVSLKNGYQVSCGEALRDAICRIPHRWTIVVAGFCDNNGELYIKADEFDVGPCLSEALTPYFHDRYTAIARECNPAHLIATGWLAIPEAVLDEGDEAVTTQQLDRIFSLYGVWQLPHKAAA